MPRQILLADDSNTIARMVQIAFAHEDYSVVVAKTADEAVTRARGRGPDVVLVDAGLGHGGKNGYDLVQELRGAGVHSPALVLTSNFAPYDEARGQAVGADGFLIKPFDTQAIIDRVVQLLAKPREAAPPTAPADLPHSPTMISHGLPAVTLPPSAPMAPAAPTPPPPAPTPSPPVAASPPNVPTARPSALTPAAVPSVPPPLREPPRAAPRATLMGLPTVGPDGLPIPFMPQAPVSPPPSVRGNAEGRTLMMEAPVIPSSPPPPAFDSSTIVDMQPIVDPPLPAPSPAPRVEAAPEPVVATRPDDVLLEPIPAVAPPAPAVPAPVVQAAPEPEPATEPAPPPPALPARVIALPVDGPRMPRPSLVPGGPSRESLRKMVAAVAAAADARIGQKLGDHPEYEAIARLSREVIEQIAWEVVPELAEQIIRGQLDRLVAERAESAAKKLG